MGVGLVCLSVSFIFQILGLLVMSGLLQTSVTQICWESVTHYIGVHWPRMLLFADIEVWYMTKMLVLLLNLWIFSPNVKAALKAFLNPSLMETKNGCDGCTHETYIVADGDLSYRPTCTWLEKVLLEQKKKAVSGQTRF